MHATTYLAIRAIRGVKSRRAVTLAASNVLCRGALRAIHATPVLPFDPSARFRNVHEFGASCPALLTRLSITRGVSQTDTTNVLSSDSRDVIADSCGVPESWRGAQRCLCWRDQCRQRRQRRRVSVTPSRTYPLAETRCTSLRIKMACPITNTSCAVFATPALVI